MSSEYCIGIALLVAGLMLAPLGVPAAESQAASWLDESQVQLAQSSGELTAKQAAARVKRRTGGKILSVRTTGAGSKTVHHVKVLLSGGRVKTFKVPTT